MDVSVSCSPPSPESVSFHLILNCTGRKTVVTRTLVLQSFPDSTLDLKKEIETHLSIPVCVQDLSYQSAPLLPTESLTARSIRSGDTLQLTYLCEGDCERISSAVNWIKQLTSAISTNDCSDEGIQHIDNLIYSGEEEDLPADIGLHLFDWLDTKCYVNKIFFESVGGLDALLALYKLLLRRKWSTMRLGLRFLETVCTQSIANFAETFPLRRMLLKRDVLDLCIQSLLRVKLTKGCPVVDNDSEDGDAGINNYLLQRLIDNALHIVCNLSELPECQLTISSKEDVLQQMVSMSLSPSYSCTTSVLVAEVFLCLAHTQGAHLYLTHPAIVDGLLDACRMRPLHVQELDKECNFLVALKCFTLVVLAQLILVSPKLMPKGLLGTVRAYMNKFLQKGLPVEIRNYEEDQVCVWATLLPYLKLLYLPNCPRAFPCDPFLTQLQLLSMDTILFFLHTKIIQENHRSILLKEGVLDFVVCLPWHVPLELMERAKTLVCELSSHVQLEPPKLFNIAKAKLAKLCFGLEKMVSMLSVGDILSEVYLCV